MFLEAFDDEAFDDEVFDDEVFDDRREALDFRKRGRLGFAHSARNG